MSKTPLTPPRPRAQITPPKRTKRRGQGAKRTPARGYFYLLFLLTVVGLWGVHRYYPQYASWAYWFGQGEAQPTGDALIIAHSRHIDSLLLQPRPELHPPLDSAGRPLKATLVDPPYATLFADKNPLQQPTAIALGVPMAENREALKAHGDKLVDISGSWRYKVSHLTHSSPLVTPHTARVLERIALNFADSLRMKGLPPHRYIISSVTRTREDVNRLKRGNGNASDNSCHFHGTTVDIAYNKYEHLPDSTSAGQAPIVNTGQLKAVLGEVLRDMRRDGYLYVLYEVHQPCFHITIR